MKWEGGRESENYEDDRGVSGGGGGGFQIGGGHLGLGAIIVLGVISYALGIDPRVLIGGAEILTGGNGGMTQQAPRQAEGQRPAQDQLGRFVSIVLAEDEDVWSQVLPAQKSIAFHPARLKRYEGELASGCGRAQTAMGPFYCPNDETIYLDTSFFEDMKTKYGGGGDFAYAYVISHEYGHHIENLLGILPKVQEAQQAASSRKQANALSVNVELMADCLAGVWAHNAQAKWQNLDADDVQKALATAQAIGDDRLQRASRGVVMPDSFTHGSSAMRQDWLTRGLKSGRIDDCNTFSR